MKSTTSGSPTIPRARLSEQIDAALYLNHPYGRPIIGWRQEIEKLNREEALAFYKRFYTPNNAVLVIAGDVSTEEVRALAEETYGKVPKVAEIGPRMRPQEPTPVAARRLTLADPRVAQPSMHRAYLVPSAATAKPGEAEALEVLAFILGHGNTSRMYRTLVEERSLAVGAGGWYSGSALDMTQFGIYGSPKPGVELQQLEDAIDAVIDNLVANGVTAEEVERATNRLIAESVYAQDNQATMARWYGAALTQGSSVERVQELARPHSRGEGRGRARRGQGLSRQAALGDRISDQGHRAEGGKTLVIRSLRNLIAVAAVACCHVLAQPVHATNIERVTSPGGIEAWLVRDTSLPLIALNFSFLGGANEDPEGKAGTGYMVSSMLDEGAGPLNSRGFHQQLEENAVELRFSVTHDYFQGSIGLRERQDQSFELLRLALNEAKFEDAATARVRAPDSGGASPRDHRPGLDRRAHVVEHRLRGPPLRASEQRHARHRCRPSPERTRRTMRAACSPART